MASKKFCDECDQEMGEQRIPLGHGYEVQYRVDNSKKNESRDVCPACLIKKLIGILKPPEIGPTAS